MPQSYRLDVGDLEKLVGAARTGAARGLALAAEHVLGEARKIVPHEEGTLERSGTASVDPDKLTAAVSFDTPYAVRQHEDLSLKHNAGRRAKYLEGPLTESTAITRAIVAAEIRRELGT